MPGPGAFTRRRARCLDDAILVRQAPPGILPSPQWRATRLSAGRGRTSHSRRDQRGWPGPAEVLVWMDEVTAPGALKSGDGREPYSRGSARSRPDWLTCFKFDVDAKYSVLAIAVVGLSTLGPYGARRLTHDTPARGHPGRHDTGRQLAPSRQESRSTKTSADPLGGILKQGVRRPSYPQHRGTIPSQHEERAQIGSATSTRSIEYTRSTYDAE